MNANVILMSVALSGGVFAAGLDNYNVVWTEPSRNALESMPCGGHDLGMNVWCENGDVLVYVSKSDAFDELGIVPKLGRIRLTLEPNVFKDADAFRQELKLREGYVELTARKGGTNVVLSVWADVFSSSAHFDIEADDPVKVSAVYESWRSEAKMLTGEDMQPCRTYYKAPFEVKTTPDTVSFVGDTVVASHENRGETAFDVCVRQQGLESVKPRLWNPFAGRRWQAALSGGNLVAAGNTAGRYASTDFTGWKLESKAAAKRHELVFDCGLPRPRSVTSETAKAESRKWWAAFWERSHIFINNDRPDPTDKAWQVGKNYQIFRYQLGCNAFGGLPTKFNGGLFTVDPEFTKPNIGSRSPDFRRWGGSSYTAQNQRLVYWPMLKSGDWDMMKPQFDFYLNALGNAEARTKFYWNHGGASFTEQMEVFGLPVGFEYGWNHRREDKGVEDNNWLEYTWDTSLEFCKMILDAGKQGQDVAKYRPLVESCLRFFAEHYKVGADGKLDLYPGSGAETYKLARNATSTLAALHAVCEAAEEPGLRARLPPWKNVRTMNGHAVISPAFSWQRINNSEIPQLYPVWPWRLMGVGRPELRLAVDTWHHGVDKGCGKGVTSWEQGAIFTACMGLKDEAGELIIKKLGDAPRRFPTWWGPGHDWLPDHNWGGSGMIALQEAVFQEVDGTLIIGAGVPDGWRVDYRLYDSKGRVLEGTIGRADVAFDCFVGEPGARAYLRLPKGAGEVKAVLYTHQNMTEEVLFRSARFTAKMDALGVAMVFVQRGSRDWAPGSGCQERFEAIMKGLAEKSAHPELASARIIPFGHSAQATFPWNFAAWNKDRTLCVVSFHGDAPRTNLCGYGHENVEWGRTRNIDNVPGLMIEGEYEWWEARVNPALAFRMMYPDSKISFFCDAERGHFDLSEETQDYIAKFIGKALANPRPTDGVLYSRWYADGHETADPHDCFWYFDEEMVALTKTRYRRSRGKKMQYVSVKVNGELMRYNPDQHVKVSGRFPENGVVTFEPVFVDETGNALSGVHGSRIPRVRLISGAATEIAPNTFRRDRTYFGSDPTRLWGGVTFCVEAEGDGECKAAVREVSLW